MDPDSWNRLQTIFERAAELPSGERDEYLAEACGGDDALRREVEALLHADEVEQTVFESSQSLRDALDLDKHLEGSEIGVYRLVRRIGIGGMGSVFLAERSDGTFERRVALKVVKKGMDTESVVRRFEMERRILARLQHPNIAGLLDGGITDDGRPYFVMEYVDGVPVNEYCDARKLGIPERLALFRRVCDAVHYAHQRLIVHRDLKPSNILVTGDGEVKLLDFGIAKLLDEDLDAELTRTGVHVFTPAYAAPEQLLRETITTETDVYALGIVLYELLSGRRPFEVWRTEKEMRERVLKAAPLKPSTAITHAPVRDAQLKNVQTTEELSENRSTPVNRLRQYLRGDLDTICLTAIRSKPGERYSSVEQMAADIQRHQDGLPIEARADNAAYRFAKFVNRHRAGVSMTLAIVVAFASVVAFYTVELARERDAAIAEQRKVTEVVGFVTGLFQVSDPYESRGQDITARELLDAGLERIRADLADRPEVQATMMRVLGEVYYQLNSPDEAEALMEDALQLRLDLGEDVSEETADIQIVLGFIHQDRGDYPESRAYYEQALATRRELLGSDHTDVLEAIGAIAFLDETEGNLENAERLFREVLDGTRRLFDVDDINVAEALSDLAGLYVTMDRLDDAEPLLREAIGILDRLFDGEHQLAMKAKRQLGAVLKFKGSYDESETLLKEAIEGETRILGPDHYEVAVTWNEYSQLLSELERYDEAIDAQMKMLDIIERRFDDPHPSLAPGYHNLATLYVNEGRTDEAIDTFRRAIAAQDAVDLPPRHVNRTFPLAGLAGVYSDLERFSEAAPIYRDILEIRSEVFGADHRLTNEIKSDYGIVLLNLDRFEEAETLLLESYGHFEADWGLEDRRTQLTARRLVSLYEAIGDDDEADRFRRLVRDDDEEAPD